MSPEHVLSINACLLHSQLATHLSRRAAFANMSSLQGAVLLTETRHDFAGLVVEFAHASRSLQDEKN